MLAYSQDMRIGVVTTGGTIAGTLMDDVIAVGNASGEEAKGWLSEVSRDLEVVTRSPLSVMSENMDPSDWLAIATSVRSLVKNDEVDGVLVLHGTDTAAFTSAALAFLCSDLSAPIVVTGSNVPLAMVGSDAQTNIQASLAALHSLPGGAFLVFAGAAESQALVHLGVRVRKLHAGGRAYKSVGAPEMGYVNPGETAIVTEALKEWVTPHRGVVPTVAIDDRVLWTPLYPGLRWDGIKKSVDSLDARAVIVTLYGSLSGPVRSGPTDLAEFVRWCSRQGVVVVGCPNEPPEVPVDDYESTVALREAGMRILKNCLPETALVKAMWVASFTNDPNEFWNYFDVNVANEFGLELEST